MTDLPTANDPAIRAALHKRLRAEPAPATVPGSLPVLFFGDLPAARFVTVGLNPSNKEYVDDRGVLLAGPAQRFATVASLSARSRAELTEAQCDEAIAWMRGYFDPDQPVYGAFFAAQSRILTGLGVSFRERQAAHLDLVQEATLSKWSDLPRSERDDLLDRDLPFLVWQLRTFPVDTILCTSRTVWDRVSDALHVTRTSGGRLKRLDWWVGSAEIGRRQVRVAGWNIPLTQATGLGGAGEEELGRTLAAALDRMPADSAVPTAEPAGSTTVRFTLNGVSMELTADQVRQHLRDVRPEPVRRHGVRVGDHFYPVMQAFEAATGISRREFISHTARRHLATLGFEMTGEVESRGQLAAAPPRPRRHEPSCDLDWHTEACVQAAVVRHLVVEGWTIRSVADTASRERGVDILADRGADTIAIEVKGYPGRSYADPARAGEIKPTHPATQARHWYAQAILASMLTRSRRSGASAAIALPDFPSYRALHRDTEESLRRCRIALWWVAEDGTVSG